MNPLPEVIATLAVSESEAAIVGSIIDKDGARGDAFVAAGNVGETKADALPKNIAMHIYETSLR